MERLAIDSNAFIAYRAGNVKVRALFEQVRLLFFPVIVMGELMYGAKNSIRSEDNVSAVNDFCKQSMPIYVDESVAERYCDIRLLLKQKGTPIPENDIWIAASCIDVGAALLSNDDHFSRIEGLTLIGW